MALNRKYAALPDLDSAPDIYETPELTDDNSTVPTTTVKSHSDDEFDEDDDVDSAGISRTRLRIDQARSRFLPAQVDARDVDFSDRLNGKRKSYKTSNRRQRILDDGTEELGDFSDEDDGENLARKIARLKREIEEAKEEYGKQKEAKTNGPSEDAAQELELASLSQVLDEISKHPEELAQGLGFRPARIVPEPGTGTKEPGTDLGDANATYTVTYTPTYRESHALAKAADFDRRLLSLEKAIGIGSSAFSEVDSSGLPRAIVPTLETLQKQISTLSEASTSNLDSISRRVRTLIQEAEQLEKSRRQAKAAQDALSSTGATPEGTSSGDSEQIAKINALYGTLPTIENLTPLLPPLLDRLRSLRAMHADAATAGETLERIEKRQADMALDIKQWREGLDKIEAAVKDGESSVSGNMKVVEGWVKDLEAKMNKLS